MISSEAEEELLVVESVYCVGGEFHRLDDRTIKIRFWDILQRIFKNVFLKKLILNNVTVVEKCLKM